MSGRLVLSLLCVVLCVVASGCAGGGAAHDTDVGTTLSPVESARAHRAVALEFDEAGLSRDAIRHYELARSLDPENQQGVAVRLAPLYERVGDGGRAWEEYERALRLDPNNTLLLSEAGWFAYRTDRLGEAEGMLRRSVSIRPGNREGWRRLGAVLGARGKYAEAEEAFEHAMGRGEALAGVAVSMARNGEWADAALVLREAIVLDPEMARYTGVLEAMRREAGGDARGSVRRR